jgi:chitodextrinase
MRRQWTALAVGALLAAVPVAVVLTAGTAGAAPLGNIALHRPTTASSEKAGHPSALAVDGNEKTRWESVRSGSPQWISVDLGGLHHVNRVRLVWARACARAYQVQTSRDAVTWLTALSTTTGDGGVDDFLLGLTAPSFGRYVRVYATQRCRTGSGYALNEFELFGEKADEVPPTAPTGVRVTGTTPSSVSVAWDAASDNVGVRAYAVYANGVRAVTTTALSTAVTGLTPDTEYTITVVTLDRAYNTSPPSAPVTARTRTGEGSPPTTPTNPRVTDVRPPCVTLAWDPSTDNVGVVAYDVTRDGAPIASVTATTVTSCGLVGNQQYSFAIVARDAAGNLSAPTFIGVTIPAA